MKPSPVCLQRYFGGTTGPANIAQVHKMSFEMLRLDVISHIIFALVRKLMTISTEKPSTSLVLVDELVEISIGCNL